VIEPIISDRVCKACGLCWCKNHMFGLRGSKVHVGYYHRCGASTSGKFDGAGEFSRVDLEMNPLEWDAPVGRRVRDGSIRLAM